MWLTPIVRLARTLLPSNAVRPRPMRSAVALVVWRLARDTHAMGMAFGDSRSRHAHEVRTLAQGLQVLCTDVAHTGAQTPDQLVQDAVDGALVGDLPLDPLGNELEGILYLLLEIAVGAAPGHGAHRSHAAVGFIGATLDRKSTRLN